MDMKAELRGNPSSSISLQNPSLLNTPPQGNHFLQNSNLLNTLPQENHFQQNPNFPNIPPQGNNPLPGALQGCLGTLDGGCIEKLLLHCASALEKNDITLAQQVMWVLNNVASTYGDPNQRLASYFLRALISRASRVCPTTLSSFNGGSRNIPRRLMSATELAGYVDLIPWHRFGFCASNSAIFSAIQGCPRVHILDFSTTHCMQWPTLIDALAKRPEGPPSLRITVPSIRPNVPPLVNVSVEEVGLCLRNFANFRNVPFEFSVILDDQPLSNSSEIGFEWLLSHLTPSMLNLREDEVLVVNCQNWLRYLSDGRKDGSSSSGSSSSSNSNSDSNSSNFQDPSLRNAFLNIIKGLNPCITIVVDEDCDLSSCSLTSRITACFNYFWIPFDALETFLPKESCQRLEYESDIGMKIESIVSFEGNQRIERSENGSILSQRMRNVGFSSLPFCEETIKEVKSLLDEHASGWGMKKEEDMLVLTWKGHNSIFVTAWLTN